jgi:hypothetical protein
VRNAVRFKSAKFNATEAKDYFINDLCFGDDLAIWLCEELKKRNLNAIEPWQEDWGWQFEAENCLISVGFDGDRWRIDVEPILGFFDKLFGKTVDASNLTKEMHNALKNESQISEIEWFESDKSGREINFAGEP